MDIVTKKMHKVTIDARKNMSLTCINEVMNFSTTEIVLKSDMGKINILGTDLKIIRFDTVEGYLDLSGQINGIKYTNMAQSKSMMKRIFK